ncbi:hypothetical protein GW17_00007730, partial [Ensete ventricosum]
AEDGDGFKIISKPSSPPISQLIKCSSTMYASKQPQLHYPPPPPATDPYYPLPPPTMGLPVPTSPGTFQIQTPAGGAWSTGLCGCCDDGANCNRAEPSSTFTRLHHLLLPLYHVWSNRGDRRQRSHL